MSTRTLARLGVLTAATSAIALSLVAPASAHVTATPSSSAAGAYTVVTFSVGHGCEGSPTTGIEIQVPESVLAVTPSRNPFYDVEKKMEQLAEPLTDSHGNEVTERVASIAYTATTPLPDGQRDWFELSLQLPDTEGETLSFPTIQTCEKGETRWVEVPAEGQDADALESPAPAFEITAASAEGDHHDDSDDSADSAEESAEQTSTTGGGADGADGTTEASDSDEGSSALGWAGLGLGLVGAVLGGLALARTRKLA
ncbi:YcnI family protein [Nocardioides oleivorans]|uniref:YcnI family copper-binding membrane protein n=1 Tax=Nocardioides oleivorans TaxID=273676 RepID=UPI0013EDF17B|nr:YcnI family protein [Nocardioides oleivorans]